MNHRVSITEIGINGDGIAQLPGYNRKIYIPFTMPGDIGDISLASDDKILRGQLETLIEPSPDRAKPPCRHFTICGGCALQHHSDQAYKSFKRNLLIGALQQQGIAVPSRFDAYFIPPGTRRRANFAAIAGRDRTIIGFHERRSAQIRDVPDCLLVTESVRAVMNGMRPFVGAIAGQGKKIDILIQWVEGSAEVGLTGKIAQGWEAQQALSDAMATLRLSRISLRARDFEPYETLLSAAPVQKRFGDLIVDLAPGAFLQPSDEGERRLTDAVIDGVGNSKRIVDLFCGNGTFTGALLHEQQTIAVDSAQDAIAALRRAGVDARARNLFKQPMTAEELRDTDCVVLDPPRAGAKEQMRELAQGRIRRIVYVSCNPQTFAQDAKLLINADYNLGHLTLVDQFTWSPHTEIVGVFEKA